MFDFLQISGPEDSKQENFSALCTCLLMRLFPSAKAVEGKGGDEGVDAFVGDFDGSMHVYQHKYFLDTLRSTQKRQIEHSLDQAIQRHHPALWTLVIPKDLTPAEQRWFRSLEREHANVRMDWWGKNRLLELLTRFPDLAAAFQPAKPLSVVILGKDDIQQEVTLDRVVAILTTLGYQAPQRISPALYTKLRPAAPRPVLRILVWGPGQSGAALYAKRIEIRNRLNALGHYAAFSEELLSPVQLCAGGLNLTIHEYVQARQVDYIVCLMDSPGSIGEVHDFAKKRELACKMMVCVDDSYRSGYSASGALRIFEGLNGKLDWFRNPGDLTECNLATRVVQQVEKTQEAKHWELLETG